MSISDRKQSLLRLTNWVYSPVGSYTFAVFSVAVATFARSTLHEWFGPHLLYTFFYPAIVGVAVLGGVGPAICATFLSAISAWHFFLGPTITGGPILSHNILATIAFSTLGIALSVGGDSVRKRSLNLQEHEKALEGSSQMIIVLDRDYRYVIANRAFLDYRGLRREDVIGKRLAEMLPPDQFESVVKPKLDECFQGKVVSYEKKSVYPKIGERDISVTYFPIEGTAHVDRIACVFTDLTELKQSQKRLEEKESLFRALVESSPIAMIVSLGDEQRADYYNPRFTELFGYAWEDVPDVEHWWLLAYPDEEYRRQISTQWNQDVREAISNKGQTAPMEATVRCKDGSERTVEFKFVCAGEKNLVFATDLTSIKNTNRALTLFRTLIDESNDAVEVVDPQSLRLLDVNERACKDLGYSRQELLSLTVRDIDPTAHSDECAAAQSRTGLVTIKESIHRRKDGSTYPVEISLKYVTLDRSYVVAVARDITERKRVHDALLESEDRYRDLIEHSEDLVCTHDLAGNFLSINAAPARILGYTTDEIVKTPMREFIASEFREQFDAYLKHIGSAGSCKGFLTVLTRTGERRTWEYHNTLRTEGVPSPIVRGMARDVTEQKRAEAALRGSERRYRLLFEKNVAGVATITLDGEVLECNDAWARVFGHKDAAEFRGRSIRDYYPNPDDRMTLVSELKEKGFFFNREWQLRRKDGTFVSVLLNSALLSTEREVPLIQSTIVDITERKQAENAIVQSEERFRLLVEQAPTALAMLDNEMRYVRVSRRWRTDFALGDRELIGVLHYDLFPDLPQKWKDAHAQGLSGAIVKGIDSFQQSLGVVRWKRWEVHPWHDRSGAIGGIIIFAEDTTEQKRAEDALRRREEDYRMFVSQSSEGIFREELAIPIPIDLPEEQIISRIRRDAYITECNDALAKMYGFDSAKEMIGKHLGEMLIPDDEENMELMRKYIRSGFRVLDRNSRERDQQGNPKVFLNSIIGVVENGLLVHSWGIQRDVTEHVKLEGERTRAEENLRERELHFRLLFDQASDGIFISDANGRYEDVNSAGAEMLGYTRDEILKLSIADVVASDDLPSVGPTLDQAQSSDMPISEWKFRRKDGSTFPGEVSARRLPEGRIQGMLRDISERKKSQEAMRQNEERFRLALNDSPITVFNQDAALRYTWLYNPRTYQQPDIIGKTDEDVLGHKTAASLTKLKRRVLDTGKPAREEIAIVHQGNRLAFEVNLEPLVDAHGGVVGLTGTSMDIAQLREITDRLQDARDKLAQEKSYLESEIQSELGFEKIIGQSSSLRDVLKKARIVAPTDSTVLLLGETGTGKELVARSVHSLSTRRDKTFIKLNCAAVPSGLLESELFGHEKGAFTSAVNQKVGRIELADGGTLFLDEVGELPLELQPKLLRVLQDREFERLGGNQTLKVDVRIISATNRDLRQDIADRKFREDLFYRLNVFPIELPPLRERRSDIPMLTHHFVEKHARHMGKHIDTIPDETVSVLQGWGWPGNIRELENMIERMVILTKGNVLAAPPMGLDTPHEVANDSLTGMEREHIIRVLRETGGVLSGVDGAAVRLGMKRTTLQSMLKRLGIELLEFRRDSGTYGSQ